MYIMCVCLFSALSRRVGALQISIIIIYYCLAQFQLMFRILEHIAWEEVNVSYLQDQAHATKRFAEMGEIDSGVILVTLWLRVVEIYNFVSDREERWTFASPQTSMAWK